MTSGRPRAMGSRRTESSGYAGAAPLMKLAAVAASGSRLPAARPRIFARCGCSSLIRFLVFV